MCSINRLTFRRDLNETGMAVGEKELCPSCDIAEQPTPSNTDGYCVTLSNSSPVVSWYKKPREAPNLARMCLQFTKADAILPKFAGVATAEACLTSRPSQAWNIKMLHT